jgi:hypothetical protein
MPGTLRRRSPPSAPNDALLCWVFFFEKKNQKTFVYWRTSVAMSATANKSLFASFSSEKEDSYTFDA